MIHPTKRRTLGKARTFYYTMEELHEIVAAQLLVTPDRIKIEGMIDHDTSQEDRLHSEGPLPQIVTGIEVTYV